MKSGWNGLIWLPPRRNFEQSRFEALVEAWYVAYKRVNKDKLIGQPTDSKGTKGWPSIKSGWNGLIWLPPRRNFERSRFEVFWRLGMA